MAMLPSGFIVSTTGVYTNYPTEKIGGVAAGITSATTVTRGKPLTSVMPLTQIQSNTVMSTRRSKVVALSGSAHTYSAKTSLASTGTFAYDQKRGEYMIMGYTSIINGSANTKIKSTGGDGYRQRRSIKLNDVGQKFVTDFRARYFSFTGILRQRTNWSTGPTSLSNTFQSTTSAGSADDQAQYVTWNTIPGELVYMQGSLVPKQDDYKGHNG